LKNLATSLADFVTIPSAKRYSIPFVVDSLNKVMPRSRGSFATFATFATSSCVVVELIASTGDLLREILGLGDNLFGEDTPSTPLPMVTLAPGLPLIADPPPIIDWLLAVTNEEPVEFLTSCSELAVADGVVGEEGASEGARRVDGIRPAAVGVKGGGVE